MNNKRRGRLAEQLENLESVKNVVEKILAKVDGILDEEKDARDKYPDNLTARLMSYPMPLVTICPKLLIVCQMPLTVWRMPLMRSIRRPYD